MFLTIEMNSLLAENETGDVQLRAKRIHKGIA
jgi:hypothetical protein